MKRANMVEVAKTMQTMGFKRISTTVNFRGTDYTSDQRIEDIIENGFNPNQTRFIDYVVIAPTIDKYRAIDIHNALMEMQ